MLQRRWERPPRRRTLAQCSDYRLARCPKPKVSLASNFSHPQVLTDNLYRVGLVVWQLGWVDLDLECFIILLGQ